MLCMHTLERAREIGEERERERKSQREFYAAMYAYFDV